MKIGIPREIKSDEYRVSVVPAGVHQLVKAGHQVFVESSAGVGSGISDDEYRKAGGLLCSHRAEVYQQAEFIIKVKEPLSEDLVHLEARHLLMTFLHFAASRELTEAMLSKGTVCLAYETIEREDGSLPCLIPMSEVAGRMSIQQGAKFLEKPMEGRGLLLGGVPGVEPAKVVVLGGGVVGTNAARVAAGLGAQVYVLDINLDRLRFLSEIMPSNVMTLYSDPYTIAERLSEADLLIGAILISGRKAPHLVHRKDLSRMKPGSVLVDVAIDQGGCVETSKPTTHAQPTYIIDNVVHYCVANMPGAVGRTSTYALTNATLPYVLEVANKGWRQACREDRALLKGLNMAGGHLTQPGVAEAFGLSYVHAEKIL